MGGGGGGGQRSKESNITTVICTKVQDEPLKICRGGNREYTERKKGKGETKREKPLPIVWMKCYLCLGTELIVCSRLLSCFFPEPPSAQTVLVPNRKVTDVGPVLWAGLHQGLVQLLYFYLCRVQGFHCKGLTDWSASWPHLTQLRILSQGMFTFRDWYDLNETIPLQMHPNT